jgi:hypothetical protein
MAMDISSGFQSTSSRGWMDICAACKANLKKVNEKYMNHLGIDVVGKGKCSAAIKDYKRKILDEFFFGNDESFLYRWGFSLDCFSPSSNLMNHSK